MSLQSLSVGWLRCKRNDNHDEDEHWKCSDNRRMVGFVKSYGVI